MTKMFLFCVFQQDESARRHNQNLDKIREKAFEMSVLKHSTEDHNDAPQSTPYERKKLCIVCNALVSELYRNHQKLM